MPHHHTLPRCHDAAFTSANRPLRRETQGAARTPDQWPDQEGTPEVSRTEPTLAARGAKLSAAPRAARREVRRDDDRHPAMERQDLS